MGLQLFFPMGDIMKANWTLNYNVGVTFVESDIKMATPQDQMGEENEEILMKNVREYRRLRKCSYLAHLKLRVWLHP